MIELAISSILVYHSTVMSDLKEELRVVRQQNVILRKQNILIKELKGLRE